MRLVRAIAWILPATLAAAFAWGANPCKPGDTLIGETAKYYYCSHVSCEGLGAQLARDQLALDTLRRSIRLSSADLDEWAASSAAAQRSALGHAKSFLVGSLLGAIGGAQEEQLDAIEKDIRRADPMGTTIDTKLRKLAAFRRAHLSLTTQIAALKVIEYPGMDIYESWTDFKDKAEGIGRGGEVLAATWDELAANADVRKAFREHGFTFSADTLKQTLKLPVLRQSIDLGQFLVDYGYDAAQWEVSRERIEQDLKLADNFLAAECSLSRRLRITVRDYNICKGKYPKEGAVSPEEIRCIAKPNPFR